MSSIVNNLIEYIGINDDFPFDYSVSIFKEFMIQEHIKLNESLPSIEQIIRVSLCVEVTNYYEIDTPISSTDENCRIINPSGQTLTGKKIIIDGIIHLTIQYVANNCEQTVHSVEYDTYFSNYAVIPNNSNKTHYIVRPYVEDISVEDIGERDIITCVTIFLEVQ